MLFVAVVRFMDEGMKKPDRHMARSGFLMSWSG